MADIYDLAIIGGGPAGITAGIYAKRMGLEALIIEKNAFGGFLHYHNLIENYPGFKSIEGQELAKNMTAQLFSYRIERLHKEITSIKKAQDNFILKSSEDKNVLTKTVIIATGSSPKKLNLPGENEFAGRGVSYCAMCDGRLFKGKTVGVVGGGSSALKESLLLTEFVDKIYIFNKLPEFNAESLIKEKISENKKIKVYLNSEAVEITGDQSVEGIMVNNTKNNEKQFYDVDGVFIFAGRNPESSFIGDLVERDKKGYIKIDYESMKTSCEGIFSAGDVREGSLRQITTAVSDGAISVYSVYKYIKGESKW